MENGGERAKMTAVERLCEKEDKSSKNEEIR